MMMLMNDDDSDECSGGSRKKIFGGPGPSSFGRQQRLCEITIEPFKNLGAWATFGGPVLLGLNIEPPLDE